MPSIFSLLFSVKLLYISSAVAQFVPFTVWQKPNLVDPCNGTPALGTTCDGGAIYAGTFDGGKYMIPPGNCTDSPTPICDGSTDTLVKVWRGSAGSDVDIPDVENVATAETASSSSYRGHVNTPAIVAHASTSSDSAADYCNNMTYGGYSDWFLPSKSELAHIYCHADVSGGSHISSNPQENPDCVSVGGKSSVLPGFSTQTYWTSTEINLERLWALDFSSGWLNNHKKSWTGGIRCVRRY